jgi:uncharacterized protein YbjT (DUF2867 family)
MIALTGATGFVGGHVVDAALAAGHGLRALTRRPQPARDGVTWIEGALDDDDALARLVAGADAVLHVAGVINAPDRAGFVVGNVDGTQALATAATAAEVGRWVQVSSLAAREPALSAYGWSKAQADRIVAGLPLAWTIVRPPAVFGPGDRETLELFRFARRRVVPLPPAGGRLSVIAVEDLAALLVTLAAGGACAGETLEPDDGRPGGWDHREFARAIGRALDRRVLPLPLPRAVLALAAAADRRLRGAGAKLTPDRARFYAHPDWVAHRPPPPAVWRPARATPQALARTARWYRAAGWL